MSTAAITKQELFARLAEGHAAAISVVTPNRRLAQELAREFDAGQLARGLTVWETADILPLAAYLERLYEDALYSDAAAGLPLLLAPAQEHALWEEAIRTSRWAEALLDIARTAADCAEAWRLAHAWRIAGKLGSAPGSEDARAFDAWRRSYVRRCKREGLTDQARLPDLVLKLPRREPALLVAYGFDVVPPQARHFLDSFDQVAACGPQARRSGTARVAFKSPGEELEAAARWARARLEAGAQRIGVVVPELGQRRNEVARVFSRVMDPGFNLPGAARKPTPFNLSLGQPLAEYPIVRAALLLLALAAREVEWTTASRLLRSPFLAGGASEFAARARLDAQLRERLPPRVALAKLTGEAQGCPLLRALLERLFSAAQSAGAQADSPHAWAQHFSALLAAAGFPGERALDSAEYQARAKFHEALSDLAKLARVAPAMTRDAALARLERLCAETLFQPESPDAPIQVLGILESAGLEFDHLWVSGLTEEAWPLAARPDPFIPIALQKEAGIPQASAETSLALDRRITAGWMGAAREVIFSHPSRIEDRDLAPSPLLFGVPQVSCVPQGTHEIGENRNYRDVIFAARAFESVEDGQAPTVVEKHIRGGTRVLADQAACPFRAFARHRLGAEGLETPQAGPDALVRGQLLHSLMAQLWGELRRKAALYALAPESLQAAIERAAAAAVAEAKLEGRFAALERARLAKLAREWLEVERERGEFEVVALEEKRALEVAGLSLSGRIDRLDRLESGGHALIDYKTGRATPNDWLGARPDEPQLPLYALNASEDIAALAYARLKAGEMRYSGFSRAKGAIPAVKQALAWEGLIEGWKKELEALGRRFAAGEACVDPKRGLATCRNCDLQPLCRVHERLSALAEEEGEGD